MGGRDRTFCAAARAPRDPRRAEVAEPGRAFKCLRDASIGAHHVRFVQNRTMKVRQWRTHNGAEQGAEAAGR